MVRIAAGLVLALACVLAGLLPVEAQSGKRVALVVGNSSYKIGPLANPVRDAEAIAEALEKRLKFDPVLLRTDLTRDGFTQALRELARAAKGAELGVVFFAGHGIEQGGRNYLIPTDATLAAAGDIELEAITLDSVLRQIDGVAKLRLVILDACRTSPFPAADRSVRGLGRVEPGFGTLVAYAAKDGTVAFDGKGRHSPYTAALLQRIATPGLDVRFVFGHVRTDVTKATGGQQVPWLYGDLGGDPIHLGPDAAADAAPKPLVAAPQPQVSDIATAWAAAKDSTSIAVLKAFRLEYSSKSPFYDRLAEARIADLKKQQAALFASPSPPPFQAPAVALNPERVAVPLTAAEERALKPKDTFKECAECPEMVVVPAGSFTMGASPAEIAAVNKEFGVDYYSNEGPQHRVTIARPLAVGKFEVTFAEWDACVAAGGCVHRPEDQGWGRGKRPVINVSWGDVTKQYLAWLSHKTGKAYRLLTEAEWEYAARAGTTTRYAFGDTISASQAQHNDFSGTVAVGSFQPNAFKLYGMHGNVGEWVQDCWSGSYEGGPSDGSAWISGECSRRVKRGGFWLDYPRGIRSAVRSGLPSLRYYAVGFRVGRTL